MQQTISPEGQEVRERQPTTETPPCAGGVYAGGRSVGGLYRPVTEASDGLLGIAYERFLEMPVTVVLVVLWVGGVALLGSCVLMLYALATLLLA